VQLHCGGHVSQGVMRLGGMKRHAKVGAERRQLKIGRWLFARKCKLPQCELQHAEELAFRGEIDAELLIPLQQKWSVKGGMVSDQLRYLVRLSFAGDGVNGRMPSQKLRELLGD